MTVARYKIQEMYDRDIKSLDSSSKEREDLLLAEHQQQLESMEYKYKTQIELLQKELDLKYSSMKQVCAYIHYPKVWTQFSGFVLIFFDKVDGKHM